MGPPRSEMLSARKKASTPMSACFRLAICLLVSVGSAGRVPLFAQASGDAAPLDAPETGASAVTTVSRTHPVHHFFFLSGTKDQNRNIFYKSKLEFSLESGWEPINIPFVYNFATGSTYTVWPLRYTLEPNIASVRWTIDNIGWRGILRGSTDYTFSGSYVDIPRGPETRYFVFLYGIRRNFVRPNWRMVPYFDAHGGVGNINAKGPDGVLYAQGQDLTFTLMNGGGIRYDFNARYSVEAGASYQHISNFYLSQPKVYNYGINVWGPMIGINVRMGKAKSVVN